MGKQNYRLVSGKDWLTVLGFTLIEMLIVISILGILAVWATPNFIESLKSGRDARRRADLKAVEQALAMYYNDYQIYPESSDGKIAHDGQTFNWGESFTVDGTTYMKKLPQDPKSSLSYTYVQVDGGNSFSLESVLERPEHGDSYSCQDHPDSEACYQTGETYPLLTTTPTPGGGIVTPVPTATPGSGDDEPPAPTATPPFGGTNPTATPTVRPTATPPPVD